MRNENEGELCTVIQGPGGADRCDLSIAPIYALQICFGLDGRLYL